MLISGSSNCSMGGATKAVVGLTHPSRLAMRSAAIWQSSMRRRSILMKVSACIPSALAVRLAITGSIKLRPA